MASSSSSPIVSSFSSQLWQFHVFLSFRGEDTRKTFVDHFYTALVQQGIVTYKDDETLPRGESIAPSLKKAIKESQIAVIIFSKNYAESSWCLDELVYIMKCQDKRGQIVMPIFYDVDPSEVRKQKRKYEEAFVRHELENNDKVESWRKALVDASNISGWETKYIANGHESKCIREIVDTISHRLHPITSSVDDNLVGVEARMQDLILKLQIGLGGKRMIGIWGVGGGGKTTLASSVYDEISRSFEGSCFIKNIREESSNKDGLKRLQEKILRGVLKQKHVEVGRVEEGRRMIKDRLRHKKVLIVLDDVDNIEQLEELAGSRDWFGEGSRVIIATRDEHVLRAHKVDVIHDISLLNNDEAMKLFCKHAPSDNHKRIKDYEQLSKDVVSYAGGLPLALRVLGRFLCDKNTNEWRSALARLKEIPEANILEKLKISFDGLTPLEKELFLDIACFFRGQLIDKENKMILDAFGFHPVIGVKVLVQKALITITEDGEFDMHDLVQEMALYIVRGEHPRNPEKYSRVWKREDVLKICAMDAKTNLDWTEAIRFQCEESDKAERALEVAANMKKLRWIDLESDGLWGDYTITVPASFPPRELCCLQLYGLNSIQLWEGYKHLPNLKMIKLVELNSLIKTPDFDGLPNLETFIVLECSRLEEIHPSFGHLENLVSVEISGCHNLKMLPHVTRSMKLETFVVSGCKLINDLSKIQQSTENIVPRDTNHIGLLFISECLGKLDISLCNLRDGDMTSAAQWELPNLQKLDLSFNRFVRLDFSLLQLPRLKWLKVSNCNELEEVTGLPSSITVVIADDCTSLKTLGDISKCEWLWKVSLNWKNKLGPLGGDKLLDSMLQGNAKDYFISINLKVGFNDILRWRSGFWVDRVETYNMLLSDDWYNAFSGILMFVGSNYHIIGGIRITIEDFQSELWEEEPNERPDTPPFGDSSLVSLEGDRDHTCVGYVSFSSLRHTGCFNSTCKMVSFSFENGFLYRYEGWFKALLVPKDDPMQITKGTIHSLEFWDEEEAYVGKTFEIQYDSNSSIEIVWDPLGRCLIESE